MITYNTLDCKIMLIKLANNRLELPSLTQRANYPCEQRITSDVELRLLLLAHVYIARGRNENQHDSHGDVAIWGANFRIHILLRLPREGLVNCTFWRITPEFLLLLAAHSSNILFLWNSFESALCTSSADVGGAIGLKGTEESYKKCLLSRNPVLSMKGNKEINVYLLADLVWFTTAAR